MRSHFVLIQIKQDVFGLVLERSVIYLFVHFLNYVALILNVVCFLGLELFYQQSIIVQPCPILLKFRLNSICVELYSGFFSYRVINLGVTVLFWPLNVIWYYLIQTFWLLAFVKYLVPWNTKQNSWLRATRFGCVCPFTCFNHVICSQDASSSHAV